MSKPNSFFQVTFVGHQGWQITTATSCILVDALLGEHIGHNSGSGKIYPPRIINLNQLPNIDGYFITHEHDDHFDLPSLNLLSRDTPIFLSGRSSIAARTILEEMGFAVTLLLPQQVVTVGDIQFVPFSPLHHHGNNLDEWDVLPYLIFDNDRHGNFFSSVDIQLTFEIVEQVKRYVSAPVIWNYTNNCSDWSGLHISGSKHRVIDNNHFAETIQRQHDALCEQWQAPQYALVCGGGWSFESDRQYLNQHVFCVDSKAVCNELNNGVNTKMFEAPDPGHAFASIQGLYKPALEFNAGWIKCEDKFLWPERKYTAFDKPIQTYSAASGMEKFLERWEDELQEELNIFAQFLYGRELFQQLYSISTADMNGKQPGVALILKTGNQEESYVLLYTPQSAQFVPIESSDPSNRYASGMECWAVDLLKLLRGELTLPSLCFGRIRFWNAFPEQLRFSQKEFWIYHHPLNRPDRYLALYRRIVHGLG